MKVLTRSKRIINTAAVTGATLALVAAPTLTFAQNGERSGGNRGGNDNRHGNTSQQRRGGDGSRNDFNANRHGDKNSARTAAYLAAMRENHKKTCSERQAWLNQNAADAKARSEKKLTGLNIMLSGVQTYVASGEVNVPNYDALNAAAVSSQTNATTAVNAIAAPQLNCDDEATVQNTLDSNKSQQYDKSMNQSIKAAKDALNIYRKDVHNLFEAALES